MIQRLSLPAALLSQIEDETRAAYPRECCGLLVGERDGDSVRVFLAYPALNVAERNDRFEIDPQTQFTLHRALRDTGRKIVGCYHSHPNGRPEPSPRDMAGAGEAGFIWLIAAFQACGACKIAGFVFNGREFDPLAIAELLTA